MQVTTKKQNESYIISVPLDKGTKNVAPRTFDMEALIDGIGRVTIKRPHTNRVEYCFVGSDPKLLEAFALCALKVVALSAKIKKETKNAR